MLQLEWTLKTTVSFTNRELKTMLLNSLYKKHCKNMLRILPLVYGQSWKNPMWNADFPKNSFACIYK